MARLILLTPLFTYRDVCGTCDIYYMCCCVVLCVFVYLCICVFVYCMFQETKQILLYFLFDLVQNPEVCIAVIGLTSEADVVNQLEKRVKSRFSARKVRRSTGGVIGWAGRGEGRL